MPRKSLQRLFTHIVRWALPAQCWLCRETHVGTQLICDSCVVELPRNHNACMRCALPLNADIGSHRYLWTRRICSTCLNGPPHFDRTVAPFLMQDGFRELLHLWKFNNRPNLSRFLASLFTEAIIDVRAVHIASGTRPLLIPIPTQWHRQFWRGFDHTWLLAQALGHAINPDAEIQPWLRNSQKRQSHHQLSRELRWANSEGRFVGDPRIQGREVVLIDDVMTTGATLSSAAHACHLAGARSVCVWCLARTPASSGPR